MNIAVCLSLFLLSVATDLSFAEKCSSVKSSNTKLFCYYGKLKDVDSCKCSHVILPPNSDVKSIEHLRSKLTGVKILVTVHEFNEGLVDLLKKTKVDGLEVDLKKLESKTDITDFISTARSKLGSDLYTAVSVPVRTDLLAKFYDFKGLSKNVDSFILQTAFLGASTNVTFHPSRLSGLWDMQNADSVVDLMVGLGAPLSKLVIAAPVQAFQFTLQDEKHTAPGSPAVEVKSITRDELCGKMAAANWTLERDQDQAGPYIFRKQEWIAFDDPTSIDIKAKYARVRGLAGLALKDLSQDGGVECDGTLLEAAYNGLSKQSRAPRGAVLQSLEREILTPSRPLDNIRVSPYRITRIIDTEGKIHAVRQDTRTEFECSRQGYFVHPRSCNRFYRCVKFDQHTDEFNVFEFDCPAGLAFDSKVEVCVWPGSLSDGSACSGSSEIAPVPKNRFVCPHEAGYYADPENCRWFFACLDHGQSAPTAYEFRCPFGLVFDQDRLVCEWPWLVPKCAHGYGSGVLVEFHGGAYGTHGGALGVNAAIDAHGAFGQGDGHGNLAGVQRGQLILGNYNGLGILQPVSLGGLHGPIEEPVSKVYSSFSGGHDGSILLDANAGRGTHIDGGLGQIGAIGRNDQRGSIKYQGVGHSGLIGDIEGQRILSTTVDGHGDGDGQVLLHQSGGSQVGHGGSLSYQEGHLSGLDGNLGKSTVTYHGNLRGGDKHVLLDGNVGSVGYQGIGQFGSKTISNTDGQAILHQGLIDGSQASHGGYQEGYLGGNLGKSTVTYHGNFGGDSSRNDEQALLHGVAGNVGGIGIVQGLDDQRSSIKYQGDEHSGSNGVIEGQRILSTTVNDGSGHGGSINYQGHLAGLDGDSGKSTVTYHGNFGGDGQVLVHGSAGHVGQIGLDDQRGSIKYQGVEHSGSNGEIEGQGILSTALNAHENGLDGSSYGGSISYQNGRLAGLDGDLGKSTVTYHGNYGSSSSAGDDGHLTHGVSVVGIGGVSYGSAGQDGGYLIGGGGIDANNQEFAQRGSSKFQSSGSLAGDGLSHQNGVVFLENGGLVQDGGVHFGQRGSSKFQSAGLSSDAGRSTVTYHGNLGKSNRIGYSVNKSPIDRASLVFGTKLRGSSNRGDVEGLKFTQQQVLIGGHDGVNQDGRQGYTAAFGSGVTAGDKIVTYHGASGDNIGILNTGVSSHGPTEKNLIDASRGSVKYQQDGGSTSYQNFNREKSAGRVNIVGGGFSAVGVYPNTYKQTTPQIQTVTAAPVSVTPHIPVVTSVPIPTTHSSDTLDVYNGNGVVANVPELQVKVQHHGEAIIPNIQQAHTATTGEALDVVNGGYVYDKPSLQFVEGAKSFVHQKIEHHTPIKTVVPVAPNSGEIGHHEQEVVFQSGQIELQDNQYPSGQGVGVESVTPSILLTEQKIATPTVSSIEFGNYQPSIVFKQPRQRVEVSSTVRPKYLENVTPIQPVLIENVTPSVNYATALIENVTPSVSIHSNGEEEVSTVRPATSYNQIHHHVQGVTPILQQNIGVSTVRGDVSYDKSVTPSILVRPVAEQNGGIKSPPLHTYSSIRFGTSIGPHQDTLIHQPVIESVTPVSVGPQPIIGHKVTSGSITSIPTASFSYQNLGAGGFEKQDVIHQGIVENVTPVSVVHQPVIEHKVTSGSITSIPTASFSYQNLGAGGYEKQDLIHQDVVENVTPVSVGHQPIIEHKVTSGSITSIPTASFSYQNLGAGGFEKQDVIHQGVVENVTPVSVGHQPIIEHKVTSGSITSIPRASLSYQNLGAGAFEKQDLIHQGVVENVTPLSVGHQPIIEHKITSGSITSIPTASFSYQNLGAGGFEKQDLIHQGVVENVTPVSVGHQPIIEHEVTSGSITSIPTASFSYQNLGARGFEKQDFPSVTPSSVVVQQPDLHSTFLAAISKGRGFSKSDDAEIQDVTPSVAYKENLIPSQKAIGQNVYLGHVGGNIEFGKFGIQQIVPEGNAYHGGEHRGFVKYTQSVTPTPETLVSQIDLGGHQNLYGTFQQFGLKNNLDQYQGRKESGGYHYAKPTIAFNEEPNYEGLEPVKEEPFVAKKAYVTGHGNGVSNVVYEENYSVTPSPVIPVVSSTPVFVTSTVRPSYHSTIQSVYNTIPSTSVKPLNYYYHDSRYSSTPKPFEIKSSVTPIVPINRPKFFVSTTPAPTVSITPVEIHPELTPITQSKPIFKYSFNSFDHQYSSSPQDIEVTKPIITPFAVKSTTPLPLPEIVTPSLQPTRAYLPPAGIVEDYRAPILKNRKIVKVVRPPTSQAIVKVNDFHPLLSAKLGAQCTCITDAVRFRNKPVKVKIDDGETVEEFVVNPNNGIGDIEGESIKGAYAVPQYEPQVVVDVTPVPEVTIGSTTPILVSKPPLVVRKRVRVRPLQSTSSTILETPVSKISDIFLKSTAVPNYQLTDDQILTGVKTNQALTAHNFDRYGPGGLRSKTETLQGTIDCQRAGLFRHPTQCNKFYSCRWDCNKNKFTLHVFNCPVHLTFDDSLGACNWPSQGPTCLGNTLLPSD